MLIELFDGSFILLWVGDSPLFLFVNNPSHNETSFQRLTVPHSIDNQEEIERIEATGGTIIEVHGQKRVNGELGITRALGKSGGDITISKPDLTINTFTSNTILLLCSDGIQGRHQ